MDDILSYIKLILLKEENMQIAEKYRTISILEAIRNIESRSFRLPAIQRKFIWKPAQIIALFDSILQGYPINTFMMWHVVSSHIKTNFRFYDFLSNYCQRFGEDNLLSDTRGSQDFMAVIDGQQRLTSIYIGLKGTYAYKMPRVWWPAAKDDNILPPRKLYIDLKQPATFENESSQLKYCMRFLTEAEYQAGQNEKKHIWFEMGRILDCEQNVDISKIYPTVVMPILKELNLEANEFAGETLSQMYVAFMIVPTIHYYLEEKQEIDYVLDVFIRTNSGGTSLSFSDLLMSIAIANWRGDARADIDNLVNNIWQAADMRFSISRDWILKTCLCLVDADIRFRVENFTADYVGRIEENWTSIRDCITETFRFLNKMGFTDQCIKAKNAIIPLVYYLYRKPHVGGFLYKFINRDTTGLHTERCIMTKWLNTVILKRTFGSQSDTILTAIRRIISENIFHNGFPIQQIIDAYIGTSKDMRFDEQYIDTLLHMHKDDSSCRSVLMLLFPDINIDLRYDIDHLHPANGFRENNLKQYNSIYSNEFLRNFYLDSNNWDTIPNLQLLNSSQNRGPKNDRSLKDWIDDPTNAFKKEDLLVPPETSLEFEDFPDFIDVRIKILKEKLMSNVAMSETPLANEIIEDEN